MTDQLLDVDDAALRAAYNRRSFAFQHALHENSAFDLANLVTLASRIGSAYTATGSAQVGDGWRSQAPRQSLAETVAAMPSSDALVLLKGLEDDRDYGQIFRRVLAEVVEAVGDTLRADIEKARATLIISSPRRVTPYHIDAETNFLLQLRGEKIVNVFDPFDRTVLTETELEAFYSGDLSAARYREERQVDAATFHFGPGMALHIPLHAPHWVRNGDAVSVAISINCSLRSNARRARVYKINAMLRRRGLSPAPPGVCGWRDGYKVALASAHEGARRLRLVT
ncbi:MAG: hypothetical protein JO060_09670 [Candidatus Eremiobacteraeota bacterium]|nr:hypothetical protein [Candidatus Eremiobacteraeota bacterium]MBV9646491.1 hypothetical protein [Candidatus Eremiobacteraeota bacterium]